MGFEQFGIISFSGTTRAEQFVEFLRNGEIRGTLCKSCGAKFFPPRSDCNLCLSDEMDWFQISGEGLLLSFTKAMFAPAGFEKDVPYMLGVAEFDDGIKVFGRIDKSLDEETVKPGLKVKLRTLNLENDRLSYELTAA